MQIENEFESSQFPRLRCVHVGNRCVVTSADIDWIHVARRDFACAIREIHDVIEGLGLLDCAMDGETPHLGPDHFKHSPATPAQPLQDSRKFQLLEFRRTHPRLGDYDVELVVCGLKAFFLDNAASDRSLEMPSKVVADLWLAFASAGQKYASFCGRAFGGTLPYRAAIDVSSRYAALSLLFGTWIEDCARETKAGAATALPLLFRIDDQLGIADGHTYRVEEFTQMSAHRFRHLSGGSG